MTKEEIAKLVNSMIEKKVDSLINTTLQTGASFDAESSETHKAMFDIASQRAELLTLLSKVVSHNA